MRGQYYPLLFQAERELGGLTTAAAIPKNAVSLSAEMEQWTRWMENLGEAPHKPAEVQSIHKL